MAKAIQHHSLKEIFDGLHDNIDQIKERIKNEELANDEKDSISNSVNKIRELLIELECDWSI